MAPKEKMLIDLGRGESHRLQVQVTGGESELGNDTRPLRSTSEVV
jgi:hypothetical protein